MEFVEQKNQEFSRAAQFKGIAIITAVLALPAASKDLAWLHSLVPLPVFYYLTVLGPKPGLALVGTGVLAATVITTILGTLPVLLFALSMLPVGYVLAQAAGRQESPTRAGTKAVAFVVLAWLFLGLLYASTQQLNPYKEIVDGLDQGLRDTYEMYTKSSELPPDVAKEFAKSFEALRLFLHKGFPALIMTSIICTVWLNLAVGHWLLKKRNPDRAPWGELKTWRMPEIIVWVVIFAALAMIVPVQALNNVGLNVGIVVTLLYFMQGLAILSSFLAKWNIPHLFKVAIYTLLVIQLYGIILIAGVGLMDVWFDFRKKLNDSRES